MAYKLTSYNELNTLNEFLLEHQICYNEETLAVTAHFYYD